MKCFLDDKHIGYVVDCFYTEKDNSITFVISHTQYGKVDDVRTYCLKQDTNFSKINELVDLVNSELNKERSLKINAEDNMPYYNDILNVEVVGKKMFMFHLEG